MRKHLQANQVPEGRGIGMRDIDLYRIWFVVLTVLSAILLGFMYSMV